MIPLADMHCHLLAGLDDGPRTADEAWEMCRLAHAEGTRMVVALAHQNPRYRDNSPDRIRGAVKDLAKRLHGADISLSVFPGAEVMVHPEIEESWLEGRLLSIGGRGRYVLLEMPHNLCVDVRRIAGTLRSHGVRVILAHPEREEELLHDDGRIEALIRCGCIVQVSSGSITEPRNRRDAAALKNWARRGVIHLLGSDGHRPEKRPPRMAEAYQRLVRWIGAGKADRICSTHGMAILQGLPLRLPEVRARSVSWFARLWH
jgi:protein-tyrosine phosphatase